jgi:hypothetical protein
VFAVNAPSKAVRPPGLSALDHVPSFRFSHAGEEALSASPRVEHHLQSVQYPSPLSFPTVFGTTRRLGRTTTALPCAPWALRAPARGSFRSQYRGPSGPFYLRHSPRLLRFDHLADEPGTGYHPGGKSPSPISSTLRKRSHVARGFVGPVVSPYVQTSRPGAVSEHLAGAQFLGVDTTSAPLPFGANLFAFRRVSPFPYRQALGGPFIVELFTAGFFRPVPECCHPPGPRCHQQEAPDAGLR